MIVYIRVYIYIYISIYTFIKDKYYAEIHVKNKGSQ